MIINILLILIIVAKCAFFWFARLLPSVFFKPISIGIQILTCLIDIFIYRAFGICILDGLMLGAYFISPTIMIKVIYISSLVFSIITTIARLFS